MTYQQKYTLISGACSFLERRRHFSIFSLKTTQILTIASISRINLKSTKMLLKRKVKKKIRQHNLDPHRWFIIAVLEKGPNALVLH